MARQLGPTAYRASRVAKSLGWAVRELIEPSPYSADYRYQAPYLKHVPSSGTILDLGSGHSPFRRATVLADRFPGPNPHRTQGLTRDSRPFVVLDVHNLPLRDKSIDYVYCAHVLEHVDDPERACSELKRVARAGYIEMPTIMKDALFAWANEISHTWHALSFGDTLVFFLYDQRRRAGIRSLAWREAVLSPGHNVIQDMYYRNLDLFNTMFEWIDDFEVIVFGTPRGS